MKFRTYVLITTLVVFLGIGLAFAANTTTSKTLGDASPGTHVNVLRWDWSGSWDTGNSNIPSNAGVQLNYLVSDGSCIFERSGTTQIINATVQIGATPGSGTAAFYNATNEFGLDIANITSTYRQTWADELGDTFRIKVGTGPSVGNTIDEATCWFWFDPVR